MTCAEKKSGCCSKWLQILSIILRVAGMALAAAAAAVMATAIQCTVIYADYGWGWHRLSISYSDFPAFVYLVAATTIAALLEAVAVFLSLCKKCKKAARVLMPLLAALAPALLYSSAGAAFAAGWEDIYYCSEPSGRRFSVCRSSIGGGHFCEQVHAAMWIALGAALSVSIADLLNSLGSASGHVSTWMCFSSCCCCSDSGSDSDSDSEPECGHGCHCKH